MNPSLIPAMGKQQDILGSIGWLATSQKGKEKLNVNQSVKYWALSICLAQDTTRMQ